MTDAMSTSLRAPLRSAPRDHGGRDSQDGAAGHLSRPVAVASGDQEGERLLGLVEFARSLALARDTHDVADAVSEHLARSLGATFANLGLIDPETQTLRVKHRGALDAEITDRYGELPLQAVTPLTDAVRTAAMVIVEDRATNVT